MFPIGDDNSDITRRPVVTWLLILVNVVVFLYELSLGAGLGQFIMRWGAVPTHILDGRDYATLFTAMFLHGGWMHLIGNMFFLKVFGDNVEDRFGHGLFLAFYLGTGLAAHAANILLSPTSSIPSVGASGAISGVLGAYIVMFHRNHVRVLLGYWVTTVPAWMMIGFWAVQQFLSTYLTVANTEQTSGVAYAAHAGGFLAGVILAFVLRRVGRERSDVRRWTG